MIATTGVKAAIAAAEASHPDDCCRPEAVADQRPLAVFGVSRRLSQSRTAPLALTACTLVGTSVGTSTGQGQMQQSPDLPGNLVLDKNLVEREKATTPQPLTRALGYHARETAPMLCSSSCVTTTR